MTSRNVKSHGRPRAANTFRIIAGSYRGRRLKFPAHESVRPSPDRVRETLFNWLRPFLREARCLDLFAGSGALGLEALSRGAAWVDFVDTAAPMVDRIKQHLELLDCAKARAIRDEAAHFINYDDAKYDIVFLDPPFGRDSLPDLCKLIEDRGRLNPGARIYLERHHDTALVLPEAWTMWREGRAGQVSFCVAVAGDAGRQ